MWNAGRGKFFAAFVTDIKNRTLNLLYIKPTNVCQMCEHCWRGALSTKYRQEALNMLGERVELMLTSDFTACVDHRNAARNGLIYRNVMELENQVQVSANQMNDLEAAALVA